MIGMGRSQQGTERHGQRLVLSWLHPTCHAVLFCCVNHDNCLSSSIHLKDWRVERGGGKYSGRGDETTLSDHICGQTEQTQLQLI